MNQEKLWNTSLLSFLNGKGRLGEQLKKPNFWILFIHIMRDATRDMIDKAVIVDEMKEQEFGSHPLARLALWMIQHTGFGFPDSYPDQSSDANAAKKRRPRPISTNPPMAFLLSFSILRLLMYCAARS